MLLKLKRVYQNNIYIRFSIRVDEVVREPHSFFYVDAILGLGNRFVQNNNN